MNAIFLVLITALVAAAVTGAIGYGFSSISVPILLLVIDNKLLVAALVVVEVVVNLVSLYLNRRAVPSIARSVRPLVVGIVPGVIAGSLLVGAISSDHLKAGTYLVLLPLIALQVVSVHLPWLRQPAASTPFGLALGVLFSTTTISGPPLALYFNNQGLPPDEFRAAVALVRVAESVFTLATYAVLGYFSRPAFELAGWIVPSVLIGMPIGRLLIRSISRDRFRRAAMSIDAVLVSIGLATVLNKLHVASVAVTAGVLVGAAAMFVVGFALLQRRRVAT